LLNQGNIKHLVMKRKKSEIFSGRRVSGFDKRYTSMAGTSIKKLYLKPKYFSYFLCEKTSVLTNLIMPSQVYYL
jgi:hypothetical protein